jgi:hypothetical protein
MLRWSLSRKVSFQKIDEVNATRATLFAGRRCRAGGADLPCREAARARSILVVRHDDVGLFADAQPGIVCEVAAALQAVDFFDQNLGIDDHAVADDTKFVGMECARRDEVENGFVSVHNQGGAGIVAALKAHDDVGVLGKKIDDLAFALVSPLGAYDRDISH